MFDKLLVIKKELNEIKNTLGGFDCSQIQADAENARIVFDKTISNRNCIVSVLSKMDGDELECSFSYSAGVALTNIH